MFSEVWDRRFLELAKTVSTWSKDPSTQVGAVLIARDKRVIGLGFNGFPKNVADDGRLDIRETKYEIVVHAEVNAILQAGHEAYGSVLYCYPSFQLPPICSRCAGVAIQAGVIGIVGYEPDPDDERNKRWKDSITIAKEMWVETGLFCHSYVEFTSGPAKSLFN